MDRDPLPVSDSQIAAQLSAGAGSYAPAGDDAPGVKLECPLLQLVLNALNVFRAVPGPDLDPINRRLSVLDERGKSLGVCGSECGHQFQGTSGG